MKACHMTIAFWFFGIKLKWGRITRQYSVELPCTELPARFLVLVGLPNLAEAAAIVRLWLSLLSFFARNVAQTWNE